MTPAVFDELKRYIGFDASDVNRIKSLAVDAGPVIPVVVDRFYSRILAHADAKRVIVGGEAQVARLRQTLAQWLTELFTGEFSDAYVAKRVAIGQQHVQVGLPQHYMFTAMEVVWQTLEEKLTHVRDGETRRAELASLHKALMLDLAIMLESYRAGYTEKVRKQERSVVEEKLTRAEHLAEIGQLAASLAHEIKNPLAGISGAIQIIREAMDEKHPHRQIITEVIGQIHRLDATVKDLLLYARPVPPQATVFPLDQAVARVLSVLREEPAMQRVRVEFEPAQNGTMVRADEAQIEHLLMNLVLNAAQASPADETIRITIDSGRDFVKLAVEDRGSGMKPDILGRAFEAFYTTKAKGTGLGLSICRKIVDAHDGTIELDSAVNQGTTVFVNLPRKEEADQPNEDL